MSARALGAWTALCGLTLATMPAAAHAADPTFRAELALRWAPIHHQQVHQTGRHGLQGAADYITAVDFDFDADSRNNWEHAGDPRFPLAAHVYFSVVETGSHYFLTYLFFHPRDWSSRFLETEHENDAEGVLLAVSKDGSRFGALRAAVTVAHSDFYSYVPTGSSWRSGEEDVDGKLRLREFAGEMHPVTQQQAETHALKAWPAFGSSGGVVYYPSLTTAEIPATPDDSHVLYRLHDVLEPGGLWQQRNTPTLFAQFGFFGGNRSGGCGRGALWCVRDAARTAWGWDDHDDGVVAGAMATDPAELVRVYFEMREPLDSRYAFNPFR